MSHNISLKAGLIITFENQSDELYHQIFKPFDHLVTYDGSFKDFVEVWSEEATEELKLELILVRDGKNGWKFFYSDDSETYFHLFHTKGWRSYDLYLPIPLETRKEVVDSPSNFKARFGELQSVTKLGIIGPTDQPLPFDVIGSINQETEDDYAFALVSDESGDETKHILIAFSKEIPPTLGGGSSTSGRLLRSGPRYSSPPPPPPRPPRWKKSRIMKFRRYE